MKIQAKEVKQGQTVQSGSCSIVVKEIVNGMQKNGVPTIEFFGDITRTMTGVGSKKKYVNFYGSLKFKENTIVNI